jgi:hypothetical protein
MNPEMTPANTDFSYNTMFLPSSVRGYMLPPISNNQHSIVIDTPQLTIVDTGTRKKSEQKQRRKKR